MLGKYENLVNILFNWESCGIKKINTGLNNGTILICKVPHVAPEAWFHEIYAPPLNENEIKHISDSVNMELPEDYIQLLREHNGINAFSDNLRVFGLRKSYVRVGDEVYQPYDVISFNNERKQYMPNSWFLIGNYRYDGSLIAYNLSENKSTILRCDENTLNILNTWQSLYDFLNKEIHRLSVMFDEKGRLIKESPMIPDPSLP